MCISNGIKFYAWSFLNDAGRYACKFAWCVGTELMERIKQMRMENLPLQDDLYEMGWRGQIDAEQFELSADKFF